MYKWYKTAAICLVYLFDVELGVPDRQLKHSQWFKRGWTLQELLAPAEVVFFTRDYITCGTKLSLQYEISAITNIGVEYLGGADVVHLAACAAQIMFWASQRQTTRVEDMAYCLMGIFDVNMPLLYGEGEKAFTRLQYEIIKESDDESIFAWTVDPTRPKDRRIQRTGMLARSPQDFSHCKGIVSPILGVVPRPPYSITNKGLDIHVPLPMDWLMPDNRSIRYSLLQLNCQWDDGIPFSLLRDWVYILLAHEYEGSLVRIGLPFHILSHGLRTELPKFNQRMTYERIQVRRPRYSSEFLMLTESIGESFTRIRDKGKIYLADIGLVSTEGGTDRGSANEQRTQGNTHEQAQEINEVAHILTGAEQVSVK